MRQLPVQASKLVSQKHSPPKAPGQVIAFNLRPTLGGASFVCCEPCTTFFRTHAAHGAELQLLIQLRIVAAVVGRTRFDLRIEVVIAPVSNGHALHGLFKLGHACMGDVRSAITVLV